MDYKRARRRYNKNSKILIIVVLIVLVIGLSIGFSAFSKNIDINSDATVIPDSSGFRVLFSSKPDNVVDGPVNVLYHSESATGVKATIDNSNPSHPQITGLKATFTEKNSEVEYRFYVTNQGKYTAYLKKIKFGDKKCTAKEGTSQALVDEACRGIHIHIRFGQDSSSDLYTIEGDKTVTNHPLEKGKFEYVLIWMSYYANAKVADGDFDVEI